MSDRPPGAKHETLGGRSPRYSGVMVQAARRSPYRRAVWAPGLTLGGDAVARYALDARAELAQPVVDALVAAVDLTDVADLRDALGTEARDEHRHAGPDVRALHALTMKPARTAHDRPVGIAEHDPSAHRSQLVDEEQPVLEHLLVDQDNALGLRRHGQGDAGQVRRECGPGAVVDLGDHVADVVLDLQALFRWNDQVGSVVV